MPDDLKAAVKDPKSKRILIVVALGAAGYVGWRWWSNRTAATGTPATVDVGAPVDASGVVGAPASGNVQYAGTVTDNTRTPGPGNFRNDAEWTQYAADKLATTRPVDTVYSALGDYLAGRPLSDAEADIVRSAIAVAGEPPSGHKPLVAQVGTITLTAPGGVAVYAFDRTWADLRWNGVSGAITYNVYRDGLASPVASSSSGHTRVHGLTPGHTHHLQVAGVTATGKPGPKSATVSVTTKK